MALTVSSTMPGSNANYTKYLHQDGQKLTKTDKQQSSVLLDFALIPWDSSFVKLTRGAYIKAATTLYPTWFTGFVTNDPDLTYIGTVNGTETWGYKYEA